MGIGVSNWRLARAVSKLGHLGVVSGTALDASFARRLQDGDPGGDLRRAISHFPVPAIRADVLSRYFIEGGKASETPYKSLPMHNARSGQALIGLTMIANFSEVFLAKEGHDGLVGINFLEKVQTPTLPSLYGAMLAGVDYVLMGAGIPRYIPGILDRLSRHQEVSLKLYVDGAESGEEYAVSLDPREVMPIDLGDLKRPKFLAIVSSHVLAATLAKKSSGQVDGFVLELSKAGGHNAPPRGPLRLDEKGEPVYGDRDQIDVDKIREIGLPFWFAGGYDSNEKLQEALELGAQGVQVGTAFAYCRESGLTDEIKDQVMEQVLSSNVEVFTDPRASGSGYPFKVVQLDGSLSEKEVFEQRNRVCDLGYLRTAYKKDDGSLGFRCPGEPVNEYLKKGGELSDTVGRKCLCNALFSNIGLAQMQRDGSVEKALVTSGEAVKDIGRFLSEGETTYSAEDVVDKIVGKFAADRDSIAADHLLSTGAPACRR